ncbi:hypothetical protein IIA79_02805 [bacterium]|nr:hypothetical protein [bacterium]
MGQIVLDPQFIVDGGGKRTAVVLSIADFEALLEQLEDHLDLEALKEAIRTETEFHDLDDVVEEFKSDGKL